MSLVFVTQVASARKAFSGGRNSGAAKANPIVKRKTAIAGIILFTNLMAMTLPLLPPNYHIER